MQVIFCHKYKMIFFVKKILFLAFFFEILLYLQFELEVYLENT